jgi:ubiquinone/menaquinone biosynthesis C-methylase UbiE
MLDAEFGRLMEVRRSYIQSLTLQLAAELGIGDLLAGGPRGVDELAATISINPDSLHRLLRTLAGYGVCTEVAPGHFALTSAGANLREDHPGSMRAMLRMDLFCNRAFADAMHSLRTGTDAFSHTFGEPLFTYLKNHPDHGVIFDMAMAGINEVKNALVIDAYDFAQARTVVDVGGGNGSLLSAILSAYPATTGVLFEQPAVIEHAREQLVANKLINRCQLVGGDFFSDALPAGDVYLMKSIIHDWPDAEANTILRNCRKVMSPDSKLLILEHVIPPGDTPHLSKEMDFIMLVISGGRERTLDEYVALLDRAGFKLTRVIDTESELSLIEAEISDG